MGFSTTARHEVKRKETKKSAAAAATNLLGEFDAVDGEEPVAERLDGAVSRESRGPLGRGLAGLGDGARGEQRHVAATAGAGEEDREARGESHVRDGEDEVRADRA